ncbi:aspartyl-phosphate phosphatase Spo0E family protein [Paenibacillus segetis]|uniref:Spo0E like sporulation regulatory protein n=1 Tax=Paenibacillus segetis TaxID=1325360 RepID=A0ABQ1YUK1_9BACL|nr:aspartyl-phosphate phosphatase Spo0E family protein [Paenibacillus segetis]GGH37108.1 hypothetical protein GCM10008013_44370 [Paenibacillus segetis]
MNKSEAIKTRIEVARQKLNQLVDQYGLLDHRVMAQSILLDELINKYNNIKYDSIKNKRVEMRKLITMGS